MGERVVVSFVERCGICGCDIYWTGRMNERPPYQNCARDIHITNEKKFPSTWDNEEGVPSDEHNAR
jgi:hypothetical protein